MSTQVERVQAPPRYEWSVDEIRALHEEFYPGEILLKLDEVLIPHTLLWENKTLLPLGQIRERFLPDCEYSPPSTLAHQREERIQWFARGKKLRNDPKPRLHDIAIGSNGVELITQRTRYLDTVITNFSLDYRLLDEPIRKWLTVVGCGLRKLKESRCSDHLGVNVLVVSSDRRLVLARRSEHVSIAPNSLDFLASGSADAFEPDALIDSMKEIWSEYSKESGLSSSHVSSLLPLGIGRNVIYGGKPEIVFLAPTTLTPDEMRIIFKKSPPEESVETQVDADGYPLHHVEPLPRLDSSEPERLRVRERLKVLAAKPDTATDLRFGLWLLAGYIERNQLDKILPSA